jgi:endonuclease/exonuclease/phosphatase family metal-dependent hydrolase
MRVLTYNIHSCQGADGRFDMNRTLAVIRAINADVVALQEVENSGELAKSFLRKVESLDYRSVIYGPTFFRKGADYGNLLLSKYPVRSERKIDLSWRKREPRGAISVELTTELGVCRFWATHFGLGMRERKGQAMRLLREMERPDSNHVPARILVGDLNEWRGFGAPLRLLRRHFPSISRCRTFPSAFPVVALDRILMASRQWRMSTKVPDVPQVKAASDHLPLVADISLA